jgi:hypothetical protein
LEQFDADADDDAGDDQVLNDIKALLVSLLEFQFIEILCVVLLRAAAESDGGSRLSLQSCRRLLGGVGASMSDDEVETLRDQLYALADVVLETVLEQRCRSHDRPNDPVQ